MSGQDITNSRDAASAVVKILKIIDELSADAQKMTLESLQVYLQRPINDIKNKETDTTGG